MAVVALAAMQSPTDEPTGWYRHIPTGRRRPGGDPEKEYIHR